MTKILHKNKGVFYKAYPQSSPLSVHVVFLSGVACGEVDEEGFI